MGSFHSSIFLRAPELSENESLYSYLTRLSIANHYDSFRLFTSVISKYFQKEIYRSSEPITIAETYRILGKILGYSPIIIKNTTLRRFDRVFRFTEESNLADEWSKEVFPPEKAGVDIRNKYKVAFCPICLQESPVFRELWYLQCMSVCADHNCFLINFCPECGSSISEDDVLKCICPKCQYDLRKCISINLDNHKDSKSALIVLQNWFCNKNIDLTSYMLPPVDPHILYNIFLGLVRAARAKQEWNKYDPFIDGQFYSPKRYKISHPFSDDIRHNNYLISKAIKALINWPNGFYGFLDSYRITNNKRNKYTDLNVDLDLDLLYSEYIDRMWMGPKFSFVQEAYNSYLLRKQPVLYFRFEKTYRHECFPELSTKFPYMDMNRAEVCLSLRADKQIKKLIKNGYIRSKESEWGKVEDVVFREDVEILAKKREQSINLNEVSSILGTDDETVLEIIKRGYLEAVGGPTVDGSPKWLITTESILAFQNRLNSLSNIESPKNYITLGKLAQRTANINISIVNLIDLVMQREIQPSITANAPRQINKLMFPPYAYSMVKSLVVERKHWITLDQFAKALHVKPATVSRWRRSHLIMPNFSSKTVCMYSKETLIDFQNNYITSQKAAEILGIGELTVQKWARSGRLKPISGKEIDGCHDYRFSRKEIEALSKEHRLTAPEMAKQLGISRSQMITWIRKGKATPTSGPGIDGMKHYLFVANKKV